MKIVNCPACNKTIIAENHSNINILQCPYCKFVDYAYLFSSYHLHRTSTRKLPITDILAIISSSIKEINDKECDPTSLIYGLHNRCNCLTPMVICQIINMLLSQTDSSMQIWNNETLFVNFLHDQVSLSDICSLNKEVEEKIITYIEKQNEFYDNVKSLENDKADLERRYLLLKYENQQLQDILTKKQEDYDRLKGRLNSLLKNDH